MPTSPIPPERASGEILKNGTAVVTTLIEFAELCALTTNALPTSITNAVNLKVACFMCNFAWLGRAKPYKKSVFEFVKINFLLKWATKI